MDHSVKGYCLPNSGKGARVSDTAKSTQRDERVAHPASAPLVDSELTTT